MSQLFRRLQNAPQVEKGQGLVEYALILVMVAVVVISILSIVGPSVGNIFSNIVDNLGGVAVAVAEPEDEFCFVYFSSFQSYYIYRMENGVQVEAIGNQNTKPDYPEC